MYGAEAVALVNKGAWRDPCCALSALLAVLYFLVVITSLLADCIYLKRGHRSFYCYLDIVVASSCAVVSFIEASLRLTFSVVGPLALCIALAFWCSKSSPSMNQWIIRHCLWHVVAGSICALLPAMDPRSDTLPGAARAVLQVPFGRVLAAGNITELRLVGAGMYGGVMTPLVLLMSLGSVREGVYQFGLNFAGHVRVAPSE
mmetsp:Transcript_44876/g.118501  ORF Transcript_44876/g.118501 Transcript_44876/m.118501 type:complete len:202 (-) Transcript_44876:94-699(-)